jgi:hypothetical protein
MLQHSYALPLNCDPALGRTERCPRCNLFHLRPGYCQAVNETASETETARETKDETPWDRAGVSKATYYRNLKKGTLG